MVLEFYLCIVNTVRKINTVLPFVTSTYIYNRIYIIIIIFACITRSSRSHNFMMYKSSHHSNNRYTERYFRSINDGTTFNITMEWRQCKITRTHTQTSSTCDPSRVLWQEWEHIFKALYELYTWSCDKHHVSSPVQVLPHSHRLPVVI